MKPRAPLSRRRGRAQALVMAVAAAATATAVGVSITTTPAVDDGARALVQSVFDAAPKVAFEAEATLTAPGGFVRHLELSHKAIGGARASYLEVTHPENLRGTRFLFFERGEGDDQQYIYLPAIRRSIRVADETRKQPFLGSDFYVSDLVAPNLDAYELSISGDEVIDGRACRLIDAIPRVPDGELYSRVILAIDPAELLIVRIEFFDPKGKLQKVWRLERVDRIDGYLTPLRQTMENVHDGTHSLLEIRSIDYTADVPDARFTVPHLER